MRFLGRYTPKIQRRYSVLQGDTKRYRNKKKQIDDNIIDYNKPLMTSESKYSWNHSKALGHGNEECFKHNKRHLLNALGNGVLLWRRESKSQNLPLNLRFATLLVPYNANTSICSTSRSFTDQSTDSEFAFVHIYFVNSSNFEEYRLTVRPEISEWFATLNEANESHWVILFDSAKVNKDKKTKSLLVDKLKSDFSRFQNRIFEFVDLSNEKSFASFCAFLQSSLFASFEFYIANLKGNALKLKESLKEPSFGLHSLVNEQFRLSRFYWNLGLFEFALAELDALANLLSVSIIALGRNESAEKSSPQWVKHLRLLPLGRHCTLLGVQMYLNTAEKDFSLVKMHAHLLAHQFILSAQNLQNRLCLAAVPSGAPSLAPIGRSHSHPPSPSVKPKMEDKVLEEDGKMETEQSQNEQQLNTLQLRHNTVTAVLRYAQETIHRFEEHILVLKANHNATVFHCLVLVWLAELFQFSEHLLGASGTSKLSDVTSATVHINILLHKQCEALRHLCTTILKGDTSSDKSVHKQRLAVLRRWLNSTPLNVPFLEGSSSTIELQQRRQSALANESARLFRTFSQMICGAIDGGEGTVNLEHFSKFALTEAIESFERFGWRSNTFFVREQLAELTIDSAPNEAHAHFRHNLCALLSHQSLLGFLTRRNLNILETLIKSFERTASEKGSETNKIFFDCCFTALSLIDHSEGDQCAIDGWHSKLAELARERKSTDEDRNPNAGLMQWPSVAPQWNLSASAHRNPVPSPLGIVHVRRSPFASSPFVRCSSNCSSFSLTIGLHNSLAIPLNDCFMKARFRNSMVPHSSLNSVFNSFHTIAPKERALDGPFSLERLPSANAKMSSQNGDDIFFELQLTCRSITLGAKSTTICTFELPSQQQNIKASGCFFLDSIFVVNSEFEVEFVLNYQEEMAKNVKLDEIVCFVIEIQPSIQMQFTEKEKCVDANAPFLVSGMEQHFWLVVSSGTFPLEVPSHLKLSMDKCADGSVEFLNCDGNWVADAHFAIPPLEAEAKHRILVRMYKGIDQLDEPRQRNGVAKEAQSGDKCQLTVEWLRESAVGQPSDSVLPLVTRRSFPLTFHPIMFLSWRTSFLADRTLFHLDICRLDFVSSSAAAVADVLPTELSLCSSPQKNNSLDLIVQAEMLNPMPLKPIVPNSVFHFIWCLSEAQSDKMTSVSHSLEFKYRILTKSSQEKSEKYDCNGKQRDEDAREHSLRHRIDSPLRKIDYEVCARFFSEQSQSMLCRVGQSADFVVSLRSLSKTLSEAETLIVSVELGTISTGHFWHCAERHKLARVKECGVGQAIFTVVPKQFGFLPFPSVTLHRPSGNSFDHSSSRNPSSLSEKCLGERLCVFYRNEASQIHILGPLHGICEETASLSSANTTESTELKKKSLRTVAKDRLQKLFE